MKERTHAFSVIFAISANFISENTHQHFYYAFKCNSTSSCLLPRHNKLSCAVTQLSAFIYQTVAHVSL